MIFFMKLFENFSKIHIFENFTNEYPYEIGPCKIHACVFIMKAFSGCLKFKRKLILYN